MVLIAVVTRILGARAGGIAAAVCLAVAGAVVLVQTAGMLPDDRLRPLAWRHALTAAITVALLGVLMWHASRLDTMQHAANERVEDFARACSGWFWEADAGGRLFWVSEGAPRILGIALESLVGKTVLELDDGVDEPKSRWFREAVQRGEPIRGFRLLRRGADEERWFEISGLPTFAMDGRLLGYRGVALDVTGRERSPAAADASPARPA